MDWNYTAVPQRGLNGRSIEYHRGFVLGGCTSISKWRMILTTISWVEFHNSQMAWTMRVVPLKIMTDTLG